MDERSESIGEAVSAVACESATPIRVSGARLERSESLGPAERRSREAANKDMSLSGRSEVERSETSNCERGALRPATERAEGFRESHTKTDTVHGEQAEGYLVIKYRKLLYTPA